MAQRIAICARPEGRLPVMHQTWRQLLLLHWSFAPEIIQSRLPDGLWVDTYDRRAFIGVTPFLMRKVRPAFLPSLPYLSNFLELNVRTYVHDRYGRPGIWFFSLDCNRSLAVCAARLTFWLPYFWAGMSSHRVANRVVYTCHRRPRHHEATARFVYTVDSHPPSLAVPGSLEFFLAERYLLFTRMPLTGVLWSGRVWHKPHPLQQVQLEQWSETMLELNRFNPGGAPPEHVMLSAEVRARIYSPRPISPDSRF